MHRFTSLVRRPVKRQGAEQYLLITLLSFALSVTLTRLFLELTGYPQLGGGPLHIAHVLWGGLLLFVASLLPIVVANRWVYVTSATLSGLGVGLFIDEVGKFITQSNDYFYPLAAPIIYAFFLLTVMLYLRVRRPPTRDDRAELYRALDAMEEVLEHDLDPLERAELEHRLIYVIEHTESPVLRELADDLLEFLQCENLELAPRKSPLVERLWNAWLAFESKRLNRLRFKAMLLGGLLGLSMLSLSNMVLALPFTATEPMEGILKNLMAGGQIVSLSGVSWFVVRLALESSVGMLLLVSSGLYLAGRDRLASSFAYLGLLLALTTVNLLVFYFDQFSSIIPATIQFILLIGIAYYRQRYVEKSVQV